jgi:hypothetical protein
MERLQKCMQADGEYVRWAKRTQYIEIDFNHEIRLCYTWRGTPYTTQGDLALFKIDSSRPAFSSDSHSESYPNSIYIMKTDKQPEIDCQWFWSCFLRYDTSWHANKMALFSKSGSSLSKSCLAAEILEAHLSLKVFPFKTRTVHNLSICGQLNIEVHKITFLDKTTFTSPKSLFHICTIIWECLQQTEK